MHARSHCACARHLLMVCALLGGLLPLAGWARAPKPTKPSRMTAAMERALALPVQAAREAAIQEALPAASAHGQAVAALARGLLAYRQGQWITAERLLRAASRSPALALADQAQFFYAESLFHQGRYVEARGALAALLAAHPYSDWRHRAGARMADIDLVRPETARRGIKALRALLKAAPDYPHPAAARLAMGEAELRTGRLKAAATTLSGVVRWSPTDPLAHVAGRHLAALAAQGTRPTPESPAETLARCTVLRRQKAWTAALQDLQRLLTDPRADEALRTAARYQIGRALYQMELFPEARATFEAIQTNARRASWRRRAQRWGAYTLERLGRFEEAAAALLDARGDPEKPTAETVSKIAWLYFNGAQYEKAAEWFDTLASRGGTWARQGRFWRVWLAYRLGDYAAALSGFKALQARTRTRPERYGYWVGRTLANQGEIDAAADTWRGIIRSAPLSYYAYQARARLIDLGQRLDPEPTGVGDPEDADGELDGGDTDCEASDEDCEAVPAEGAGAAVGASAPTAAADASGAAVEATEDAGAVDPDAAGGGGPATNGLGGAGGEAAVGPPAVTGRPELDALAGLAAGWGDALPGLVAAYELAALGETAQAALRLRAVRDEWLAYRRASRGARRRWAYVQRPFVDYRPDSDRGQWGIERADQAGRPLTTRRREVLRGRMPSAFRALLTTAFRDVGDHHYVRRMVGRSQRGLVMPPEAPENQANWQRWYPQAFGEVVRAEAAAHGIEPFFVWALMTVESSYNPWAISRVGARGLMQVMPHTGTLVAERMGRGNFGASLLIEPEVAIEQAAWYFEQLLAKFNGQLPLAIAGYNAGPHRVASWLLNKGHLPMDEFIEEIPYTEAREYTKKVLRYLALYRRIYEGDARLRVSQIIDPDFRDNINF